MTAPHPLFPLAKPYANIQPFGWQDFVAARGSTLHFAGCPSTASHLRSVGSISRTPGGRVRAAAPQHFARCRARAEERRSDSDSEPDLGRADKQCTRPRL